MSTTGELPGAEVVRLDEQRARRPHGASRAPSSTEPGRWMTRNEVAVALGISKTSVRRLEESGVLRPVKERGVHRFERAEIETMAAARGRAPAVPVESAPATSIDSTAEARCFVELARGTPLRDIARLHGIPAAQVEAAARAWNRLASLEGEVLGANLGERVDELELSRSEIEPTIAWLAQRVTHLEAVVAMLVGMPAGVA